MKKSFMSHFGASAKGFSTLRLAVILSFVAFCAFLAHPSTAKASSFKFVFSGGAGYSGEIDLAEASNLNGNVNDVVGGYVITPNLGMNVFNPATASTFGPLVWDQSSGLTFFHLSWIDGIGNHAVVGVDSIRNTGGGFFDATFGGHWAPPSGHASVPDGGYTLLFLAVCLGILYFIPSPQDKY